MALPEETMIVAAAAAIGAYAGQRDAVKALREAIREAIHAETLSWREWAGRVANKLGIAPPKE